MHKNVVRLLNSTRSLLGPIATALALLMAGARAQAQTATDITGLYYTGLAANGTLAAAGTQAADWTVSYASINGGASANATYEGAGYVISPSSISGSGYTPNTSGAQWITAPGAAQSASGSSLNTGGDFLPGNGNSGSNEGIYVYTLAFTITGTGSAGTVVNSANSKIQITMTMAADDQYSVYVNPTGSSAAAVVLEREVGRVVPGVRLGGRCGAGRYRGAVPRRVDVDRVLVVGRHRHRDVDLAVRAVDDGSGSSRAADGEGQGVNIDTLVASRIAVSGEEVAAGVRGIAGRAERGARGRDPLRAARVGRVAGAGNR